MSLASSINYQKTWQISVHSLLLVDFTNDRKGIATFTRDKKLCLFDHAGRELWSKQINHDLKSISISDTLEILAIDTEMYMSLYGSDGTCLWRKRPFPVVQGVISASGQNFAFVTNEPSVVGTSKTLRVNWVYRNLLSKPMAFNISSEGDTTAFGCENDLGKGLAASDMHGKNYNPFMGVETVTSIDISKNGEIVLAIDKESSIFCFNIVKSFGIWKGQLSKGFLNVCYANKTSESIAYTYDGLIVKLCDKGTVLWEHRFPHRLLKASISPDSSSIYYATENGQIGCLMQNVKGLLNRMDFLEISAKTLASDTTKKFRKVWSFNLLGESREAHPWKGQDGVEYCLVCCSDNQLTCVNDLGEEVWDYRVSGVVVKNISVSASSDICLAVTSGGMIGLDLSGYERFKVFGNFKNAHVFDNGSILVIDQTDRAIFYLSHNHCSHNIETDSHVTDAFKFGKELLLKTTNSLYIIDNNGKTVAQKSFSEHPLSFTAISENKKLILSGDKSGNFVVYDGKFNEAFSYCFKAPIKIAFKHLTQNVYFVSLHNSEEIIIVRPDSGEIIKTCLTGHYFSAVSHSSGAIMATDSDQIGLVGFGGEIIARYTSPYNLKKLYPCHRKNSALVLDEESISCIAPASKISSSNNSMGFLEI